MRVELPFNINSGLKPLAAAMSAAVNRPDRATDDTRTVDSFMSTRLSSEEYKEYVQRYLPPRKVRQTASGLGISGRDYYRVGKYLVDVGTYMQKVFVVLRHIYLRGASISEGLSDAHDVSTAAMDSYMATSVAGHDSFDDMMDKAVEQMLSGLAHGNSAVIKKEGRNYFFDFVGSRGGSDSTTTRGALAHDDIFHPIDDENKLVNYDAYDNPVSTAAMAAMAVIQKTLFADNAMAKDTQYKRIYRRFDLTFDVAAMVESIVTGSFKGRPRPTLPEPPERPSQLELMEKQVRLLAIREPDSRVTEMRRTSKLPDAELPISTHYSTLCPAAYFSMSLTMPEKTAKFIAQSEGNEAPSLYSLNMWINVWARGYLRVPRSAMGGMRLADIPKFILRASSVNKLNETRKQLGLYTEPGRNNVDGITINAVGGITYMPHQNDSTVANAEAYEKLMQQQLELCYKHNIPLSQKGENKFAFLDPELDSKLPEIRNEVSKFSGSVLGYSWDYNCAITVDTSDNTRSRTLKLGGSAVPDELNLATYMRTAFNKAMPDMFTSAMMSDGDKTTRLNRDVITSENIATASPFFHMFAAYEYLAHIQEAPDFEKLVLEAATEMKIKRLDEGPNAVYDFKLYDKYITPELKITGSVAVDGIPAVMQYIISNVLRDAKGSPGTNLWKVVNKEGETPEDSDYFFDATFSTFAEIRNIFNYFGGRLLQRIAYYVASAKPKSLMERLTGTSEAAAKQPSFLAIANDAMPMAVMLSKYVVKAEQVYAKADELEAANKPNESFSEDDLKIPGVHDKFSLFPHQFDAFKVLSNFPRYALLDVAPGGGKTTMLLVDIANMIAHGKIKRPLILCPNNLAKDWCAEMHRHTEGKWNMIPLTSGVYTTKWGDEQLTKMIKDAPPNTIVVAGYSFLSQLVTYTYPMVIGTHVEMVSEPLEFLKKFGFDYIGIDESHRTRNSGKKNRRPSRLHLATKQITTMSCVKYVREATGSFVYNDMADPIGQAALFNTQIYRTLDEFEADNKVRVEVNGRTVTQWTEETPANARKRLGQFAAVISAKRRDWAFMLPIPLETFVRVKLVKQPHDLGYDPELADAHQKCYDAILSASLEEIKQDKSLSKLLSGKSGEDDEDEDDDDGAGTSKRTTKDGLKIDIALGNDDDTMSQLEVALRPYLQRLDRILTDPLNDVDAEGNPFGDLFFKGLRAKDFVSNVALAVNRRLDIHFAENQWRKGGNYTPQTVVDYGGSTYIARPEMSIRDNAFDSFVPPDRDTDNWKEQARGKVIIFCRFTRSVDAIFRALPPEYKKMAVRFHGGIDNRVENLEAFKKDPKVQIIVANEMTISEGQNLQMASRIIRVETPWAPGELDQAISRIFRPDPSGKFKRETIFLDWIIVEGTLSVAKFGRLISKMLVKTKFDEAENPRYKNLNSLGLPTISMSLDNIRDIKSIDSIMDYVDEYGNMARIQASEFNEMRRTKKLSMIDIPRSPIMQDAEIIEFTPYVQGYDVPDRHGLGIVRFADYMQDLEKQDVLDLRENPKLLVGRFAHTEFGNGVISGIRTLTRKTTASGDGDEEGEEQATTISSVKIKLATGDEVTVPASMLYLPLNMTDDKMHMFVKNAPRATPKSRQIAKREEEKLQRDEDLAAKRARALARRLQREAEKANTVKPGLKLPRDKDVKEPVKPPRITKPTTRVRPGDDELILDPRAAERKTAREGEVHAMLYNGFWTLEVTAEPLVDRWLKKEFEFEIGQDYAAVMIRNRTNFDAVLDQLDAKFTITNPRWNAIADFENAFTGRAKNAAFRPHLAPIGDLVIFQQQRHRLSTKGGTPRKPVLTPYPIMVNTNFMIVVDIATNPSIVKYIGKAIPGTSPAAKWTEFTGSALRFFKTKTELVRAVKEMRAQGLVITNYKQLVEEVENMKVLQAKLKG